MSDELLILLQRAVGGNDNATQTILRLFAEQSLTEEQTTQIHLFIKIQKTHFAIYLLGMFYKYGYGVRQDYDMSFLNMREAAAKGNAKATYEVGHHFLEGYGVEKNYANALQWLQMAAGSPYYIPEAMFDIAEMYAGGLGVTVDERRAQEWYQKAADRGHLQAQTKIKNIGD